MPPNGYVFLAKIDGAVAGMAAIRKLNETTCELKRLYVRPDFRGRGLARALMMHRLSLAQELGYATARLDSPIFSTSAHELFKSVGFYPIDPYSESEGGEEMRPYLKFFEKQLGE